MKNLSRIIFVIAIAFLANFALADFAFAQTPPSITPTSGGSGPTKAELEDTIQKWQQLVQKKITVGLNIVTEPEYLAFKNLCKAQGVKLQNMDGTPVAGRSWSTWFNAGTPEGNGNLGCFWGQYQGPSTTPDNLGRNIRVDRNDRIDQTRYAIVTGQAQKSAEEIRLQLDKIRTESQKSMTKWEWFSELVGFILRAIFNILTWAALGLTSLAGLILSYVTSEATNATRPDLVLAGWVIIRNFMNMLFILALIVISIATILKLEKYNYKHLLVKLILMAILINFSLVISQTLVSAADTVTNIFVTSSDFKSWGAYTDGLINEGQGAAGFYTTYGSTSFSEEAVKGLFKLMAALIMAISFLAIALLFLVRMVGLWVLMIISPMAYALNILPFTEKWAHKWWETFFKYLIWAPVAMFFLML